MILMKFGNITRGELYITAEDLNGTFLASPYRPGMIGHNASNLTDVNGVAYNMNLLDIARRGSGFTCYIRANPAHSNALELKLTHVLKIDDGSCLLSGMYLPGQVPIFSNESRRDLVSSAESARELALNHTKEEALKAFNDPKGKFVNGELYITAYDFNGTRLAHPYMLEAIGKNALNVTDPNGVDEVRDRLDIAANWGDGFIYYIWPNPVHSDAWELKLTYITRVNAEWFLGPGIYLSSA